MELFGFGGLPLTSRYVVRARHTGALAPAFTLTDNQCGFIEFDQPVKTVAGQSTILLRRPGSSRRWHY